MRIFYLYRSVDVGGQSGPGFVAEGVQFTDGTLVMRWLGKVSSKVHYENADDLLAVHGHGGKTIFVWDEMDFVDPAGMVHITDGCSWSRLEHDGTYVWEGSIGGPAHGWMKPSAYLQALRDAEATRSMRSRIPA